MTVLRRIVAGLSDREANLKVYFAVAGTRQARPPG